MVAVKQTGTLLRLLQASAFISGAIARCLRGCPTNDPLIALLNSQDSGQDFCREYLSLAPSTIGVTITSTIIPTLAKTAYVTAVVTETDATATVTVSAVIPEPPVPTLAEFRKREGSVEYPSWLTSTYGRKHVSSACACLSVAPSVITTTTIAEKVTITGEGDYVTITQTTTEITTTTSETAIATETVAPASPMVNRVVKIQAINKSTGVVLGWLFNRGPTVGITSESAASSVEFNLSSDVMSGSSLRITLSGNTQALAYPHVTTNLSMLLLTLFCHTAPPGSAPVDHIESDIWNIDTQTNDISVQWIDDSGGPQNNIRLFCVESSIWAVGNVDKFNTFFQLVLPSKRQEITLKYVLYQESQ
ncbi:hypothetical protein QBC42DRAFT_180690 [Cladorrhinum samala]|uniref:Uncharacterized protein n=1 Tax=Cladorrhinum samala TaxID=585594 RepID=A0AAV9HKY4_9PEZI|nr:hypothetical protein QBC42DRAFT_180690 [Cladorrhinum samala]